MTAQLSGSVAAESLLYSFTPAAVGRGGSPAAPSSSAPPPCARRLRAHSVPGEPTHRPEEVAETHTDSLGLGQHRPNTATATSAASPSLNPTLTSLGGTGAGFSSGAALGPLAMPAAKPPSAIGMPRCGSADRHQHHPGPNSLILSSLSLASLSSLSVAAAAAAAAGSGTAGGASGAMPIIGGAAGVERGLPPMRHSISGNPNSIGLPKLDLPASAFGGGALDFPGLGAPALSGPPGRRSLSGGFSDAAAAAAFLDSTTPLPASAASLSPPVCDGSAPPSPSRLLAPLRVSGAFAAGGGLSGASPALSSSSAAATDAASAAGGGGGWCGGSGGSGSRRYTTSSGPVDAGGLSFSPGPLLPCASEGGVASPLTPEMPSSSNPCAPPRRSYSLTSRVFAGGSGRLLGGDGGGGGGGGAATDGAAAIAPPIGDWDSDAPAAADRERGGGGGSSSTAVKAMYDINNDMQRAAGSLLALHAPAIRPKSPPPAPPPPAPAPLNVAQLAALKEAAPELQWELRVAVRRVFQVLRQELSAAPAGRQLGSSVHECWATLDSYLEGTTELTCALVEGALDPGPREPAASAAAAAAAAAGPSGQRLPAPGGVDGAAAGSGGASTAAEAQREAERLRTDNHELRRQLEECRARIVRAEARAAAAEAAAAATSTAAAAEAASGGSPGGGARGAGAGSAPRPPHTSAAPPLERCYSTSPRRGKHALLQSLRDDSSSSADGGGAAAAAASPLSSSPSAPEVGAAGRGGGGAGVPGPRRFDRAAVLARGPSYEEMVIEGDNSEDESDVADDSVDARRHMLTYHSASFAEWVRGARRR